MRTEEKAFFTKIKKAITTNPFSSKRLEVDLELTGMPKSSSIEQVLKALIQQTTDVINQVSGRPGKLKNRLSTEEFELFEFAVLFLLFHLFSERYDELIRQQIAEGEISCKVSFADEFLSSLQDYGFSRRDSLRTLALFFQMRRAFFFISRISGESQCVRNLRKALWNNIFTCDIELYEKFLWNRLEDFSTMLLGETGTGKGLAASAIGRSGYIPFDEKTGSFSESFTRAFVSINLSQFPEQLIESELFGHRKGAFTGAMDSHKGIFSRCSPCGAIFLDEIGDVSVPVQIKLLQVLQERSFTAVGGRNIRRFQGRVIAATNKSLDTIRSRGEFRDDFYYRLCSDIIRVPSLRRRLAENPGEIHVILEFTINNILGTSSPELVEKIGNHIKEHAPRDYSWPGNIRELEQSVRRILISNNYNWQNSSSESQQMQLVKEMQTGRLTAQQLLARYCALLYQREGTYGAVAQRTELDRRTVKKYILQAEK
jgi:hypothetical protein